MKKILFEIFTISVTVHFLMRLEGEECGISIDRFIYDHKGRTYSPVVCYNR